MSRSAFAGLRRPYPAIDPDEGAGLLAFPLQVPTDDELIRLASGKAPATLRALAQALWPSLPWTAKKRIPSASLTEWRWPKTPYRATADFWLYARLHRLAWCGLVGLGRRDETEKGIAGSTYCAPRHPGRSLSPGGYKTPEAAAMICAIKYSPSVYCRGGWIFDGASGERLGRGWKSFAAILDKAGALVEIGGRYYLMLSHQDAVWEELRQHVDPVLALGRAGVPPAVAVPLVLLFSRGGRLDPIADGHQPALPAPSPLLQAFCQGGRGDAHA